MRHETLLFTLIGFAATACGSSKDDNPPQQPPLHPAVASFLDVFHASRYSQAASEAKKLDDAATASPNDGPVSFVRFLAHLWHLDEYGRDQQPDPAVLQAEAMAGLGLITAAKANNPTDARVDCFLGIQQVNVGRAIMNPDLVAQGYQTIDASVSAWPQFSLFCKALAYDSLPAEDADFMKAVDAMYTTFEVCFGEKIDRNNPDISKYLNQATDKGLNRACWNDWLAPHNAEGTYLYVGDLLVKAGNVPAAKVAYADAKLVKEYPQWPYKYLLDERLSADLDAKAALYRDTDPKNDPPLGGETDHHGCTFCHAATADER
jgi:hypothetical protein